MRTLRGGLFTRKSHIGYLASIVSIILILAGYIYYVYTAEVIQRDKEHDLRAIGELKVDQIVNWHKEREADAKVISGKTFLIDAVQKWLKNRDGSNLTLLIKNELLLPREQYDYEAIFLSSRAGRILLSVGSDLNEFDPVTLTKVIESRNKEELTFTDFYYCSTENKIHYDIIAPLIHESNGVIALLVFRVNPQKFIFPLIQTWPTPSKTAETLLIRKEGENVIFLNELRHRKKTALKLTLPMTREDLPAVQAVSGKTGIFIGRDYRNIEVLSYLTRVPGTDWYMVTKVDRSEILSELQYRGIIIIVLSILIVLSITTGATWLYYFRQRNIYKQLFEAQQEFKTTLQSIGDAVITTDKTGRIKFMNPVAEKLTGWKESAAWNQPLDKVFNIINEETREKVESPVNKVIQQGIVVGLANHTILISKEGNEIPIADSGAPIANENGKIVGVVLVFRDQSEERLNQKILNTRLTLFEYSSFHSLTELLTKTLDEIEKITRSTISFYHLISEDEETLSQQVWSTGTQRSCKPINEKVHSNISKAGKWADCVHQRKTVIHNDYSSLLDAKGLPENHVEVKRELLIPITRDNKIVAVLGIANKPSDYTEKDVEIVSYLADVSWEIVEKKRAEENLRESNRRFNDMIDNLSGVVYRCKNDPEWTMEYTSEAIEQLTGYKTSDFINNNVRTYSSIIHPEDQQKVWEEIQASLLVKSHYTMEYRIINSNNDIRWVWERGRGIFASDKLIALEGFIEDITDRKLAEKEIMHLNRLYSMLSQTNQTIVRLNEKDQLLREICKVAIAYGGFQLAWIGLYNHEKKRIETYVWHGEDNININNDEINLSASLPNISKISRAFEENNIVLTNDIADDPDFENIVAVLLNMGCRSFAATPIYLNRATIGVYVLCSSEINFFRDKEINLLQEVGSDISFALEMYDKEAKRIRVEKEKALLSYTIEESANEIFIFDATTLKFRFVNAGAVKNLGYSIDELNEMTPLDIKKEYTNERFSELIKPLINNEKEFDFFETSHTRKDGSTYPCEIRLQLFEYENDKVFLAIVQDITKRKLAEEAMRQSEEKFRSLFENHTAIKFIIDPVDGHIVDANKAAALFYNFTIDELEKKNIREISLSSPEGVREEMTKAKNSSNIQFEAKHRKADGTICDVEVYSSKVLIGDKEYLHSIIHDITEKKKAEEQIKMLSRALEQSPVSVIITDPDGNIEFVNPKFSNVTGYSFEEVKGKNPRILKSGKHSVEFYENLWNTILTGKEWQGEMYNKKKNGNFFWEEALISPISDNYGNILHFVAVKEDITEKKKMVEDLISSKEKAEASDKLKSEFLAQISHEIRTPLNALMSYTSLLRDEYLGDKSGDMRDVFNGISSSGDRIIRTIDLILNASELQIGMYNLNKKKIDIKADIIQQVHMNLKHSASIKNIELRMQILTQNSVAYCDEYSVYQTIVNLVDNAIKYTKNGWVELRLLRNNQDHLMIEIEDTGIGISEEYKKRLFEAFSQEDTGYTRRFEGTGLGLSLVKKYCELNDINIEVESRKDIGTKFTLTFSD